MAKTPHYRTEINDGLRLRYVSAALGGFLYNQLGEDDSIVLGYYNALKDNGENHRCKIILYRCRVHFDIKVPNFPAFHIVLSV